MLLKPKKFLRSVIDKHLTIILRRVKVGDEHKYIIEGYVA